MNINELSGFLKLNCLKHLGEPLNMFCDDDKCESRGLICSLCEDEAHANHNLVSFKLLLKEVHDDLAEFNSGKALVRLAAEIDYEYSKCTATSHKLKNKDGIQILKQSINNYFGKLKNMVLRPKASDFQQMVHKAKLNGVCTQEMDQFFLSYRNQFRETKSASESSNYVLSISETIQDLKNKQLDLEKAISSDDKMQNILQIYVSAETYAKVCYSFSETMKHSSHTLTNKTTIVQNNNYNTNMALIEPSIEGNKISSTRTKVINIKITRLTSWISLGICHQNIIKGANFYFNTGSIGHGAYVISNDGYSWHNSSHTMNSFYNTWTFQQDDIITITVTPKNKTIKFSKAKNPDSSYETTYDSIPGDKLHFCVSLSSHNESVEIINS